MPHGDHSHEEVWGESWTGVRGWLKGWYFSGGLPRRLHERFRIGNPRPRFFEIADLKGEETALDAGCGPGFYSLEVAKRLTTGKVICVDPSHHMRERTSRRAARKKLDHRVDVRNGDLENLPVDDHVVDVGFSVAVWHHVEDQSAGAREMFRVIKPGGKLITLEWTPAADRFAKDKHEHGEGRFDPAELVSQLENAGFTNMRRESIKSWELIYGDRP